MDAPVSEGALARPPLQLLRAKLRECYKTEGVNHVTRCKEVRSYPGGRRCRPLLLRAGDFIHCVLGLVLGPHTLPACPPTALQLAEQYLESIKGVGTYRANSGPHDKAMWAKPQ